jgi:hypothetical protein
MKGNREVYWKRRARDNGKPADAMGLEFSTELGILETLYGLRKDDMLFVTD